MSSPVWLFQPHGLQHASPSPSPGACSNSCALSQQYHPPSHPLSSPSPAFDLSQHQGFSNESAVCIRWPKHQNFSFSIGPSNEYSGLISIGIDWFDLLAVQGTLKSLLQHYSSKAFGAQPSLWSKSHICTWLLDKP